VAVAVDVGGVDERDAEVERPPHRVEADGVVGLAPRPIEDLDVGLAAVDELRPLVPPGQTLAQFALRWILMSDAVSCTIPGAKRPDQVEQNCAAADLPPLTAEQMRAVRDVYDRRIRPIVHHRW